MATAYTHHLKTRDPYDRTSTLTTAKQDIRLLSSRGIPVQDLLEASNSADIPAIQTAQKAWPSTDQMEMDEALARKAAEDLIERKRPTVAPDHAKYPEELKRFRNAMNSCETVVADALDVYQQARFGAKIGTISPSAAQILIPYPDGNYIAVTPVEPIGVLAKLLDNMAVASKVSEDELHKPRLRLSKTVRFQAMATKTMLMTRFFIPRVLLNDPPVTQNAEKALVYSLSMKSSSAHRADILAAIKNRRAFTAILGEAYAEFQRQRIAQQKACKDTETKPVPELKKHEPFVALASSLLAEFSVEFAAAKLSLEETAEIVTILLQKEISKYKEGDKSAKQWPDLPTPTHKYWQSLLLESLKESLA